MSSVSRRRTTEFPGCDESAGGPDDAEAKFLCGSAYAHGFSSAHKRWALAPLALFTLLAYLCARAVPAGHVGVVDLFGDVSPVPLPSGLHFINPLARVHPVSVRLEMVDVAEDVPTREGLTVHLEAAALFRLQPAEAPAVVRTLGTQYLGSLITTNFHSMIREVTSAHDAKDLYTAASRSHMTHTLRDGLQALVKDRGLIVEDTPIRELRLPAALQGSIEQKLLAEQVSQKMQFILDKERQEAERKRIEAQGIASFQRIVSSDITEGLLRWKGIEATQELTSSGNMKTVIIGQSGNVQMILPSDTPGKAPQ